MFIKNMQKENSYRVDIKNIKSKYKSEKDCNCYTNGWFRKSF